MPLPRQNPLTPSARNTFLTARPKGSDERLSWYSSLMRSNGARSVRTTTVLITPEASRSAVVREIAPSLSARS